MLQAGLNLLYQGMLRLTTKPHMLISLVFWEVTPGFSSALGLSDANLRTGILLGQILYTSPAPRQSRSQSTWDWLFRRALFPLCWNTAALISGSSWTGSKRNFSSTSIFTLCKAKKSYQRKHWGSISLGATLELCILSLVQAFTQGSSSCSLDLVFNRWWETVLLPYF